MIYIVDRIRVDMMKVCGTPQLLKAREISERDFIETVNKGAMFLVKNAAIVRMLHHIGIDVKPVRGDIVLSHGYDIVLIEHDRDSLRYMVFSPMGIVGPFSTN